MLSLVVLTLCKAIDVFTLLQTFILGFFRDIISQLMKTNVRFTQSVCYASEKVSHYFSTHIFVNRLRTYRMLNLKKKKNHLCENKIILNRFHTL